MVACSVATDGSADVTDIILFFLFRLSMIFKPARNERKTCVSEVLYVLADLLRKCGLTWTRILGFLVTGLWL